MNSRTAILTIVITLFLLWFSLPETKISVPYMKKRITIKPKSISITFFGKKITHEGGLSLGLDLQGGSRLVFEVDTSKTSNKDKGAAVESARDVVERRVNFFGVSEPNIIVAQSGEKHRISVEIPGKKNPQEAIDLVGKTALLDFREYHTEEQKIGTQTAKVPVFTKTELSGKYLQSTKVIFDQNNGKPQVSLVFNTKGRELFARLTKKNIQQPLGIFLDDQLVTAPVVQQEIKDGNAVITGDYTVKEAQQMVRALNAGALPLPLKLVEQKSIEATLGVLNIQKSIFAGIIGLFSVAVFMIVLYRKEGVVAVVSLFLYGIYSLALYKTIGVVMSLSGIAGFILSVGMAVDSNILISERIKEERLRLDDERRAVKVGFFKALSAIRDANINTLLVCFVLFNPFNFSFLPQFGLVKGFALTLALGVVVSLFTGVFITKNILWKLYKISS